MRLFKRVRPDSLEGYGIATEDLTEELNARIDSFLAKMEKKKKRRKIYLLIILVISFLILSFSEYVNAGKNIRGGDCHYENQETQHELV